mmetsp:Transcript_19633/g.66366  ORF Transcript_19633/g.66366 Transcript_19633/m.66366 type:complete len:153 (+) Transcript_19633:1011-1469(+)
MAISSLVRDSLQRPFSVCRPGLGWELTLSHRHKFDRGRRKTSAIELDLLHQNNGVYASRGNATSSLEGYFDLWNAAMDGCDAIVTYPETTGRISSYQRPGLSTSRRNTLRAAPRRRLVRPARGQARFGRPSTVGPLGKTVAQRDAPQTDMAG